MSRRKVITGEGAGEEPPRPHTVGEMRMMFLDHVRHLVDYWAAPERGLHMGQYHSIHNRCSGLAHSFLSMLGGCSMATPGMGIVPAPHEEDEEYCRSSGQNWWTAEDINNGNLPLELYNDAHGKRWCEENHNDRDIIRYAMDEAVVGLDGTFSGAEFSKAFTRMTGVKRQLDELVVKGMLSGRQDVKRLAEDCYQLIRGK